MFTAKEICNMLAKKHKEDFFLTECKTGKTWNSETMQKLDAWAMKKSWEHPCITGYEVKVSRQDFIADAKWRTYLDFCNEFYFVCPPKVILPDELPTEVGLLYTAGTRFSVKKKAHFRDIQIPDSIFRYILMNRVIAGKEDHSRTARDFWEGWLKEKRLDGHFGYHVGKTLAQTVKERITGVAEENERLKNENRVLQDVQVVLSELNIPLRTYNIQNRVKEKIEELNRGVPGGIVDYLSASIKNLQVVIKFFEGEMK